MTAIQLGIMYNLLGIIDFLLQKGADISINAKVDGIYPFFMLYIILL